jgi:hypothetical protein
VGSHSMGSLMSLGRRNASQSVASLSQARWSDIHKRQPQRNILLFPGALPKAFEFPLEQVASAKRARLGTKPFASPRPALSTVLSVCRHSWSLVDSTQRCLHHLGKDHVNATGICGCARTDSDTVNCLRPRGQ